MRVLVALTVVLAGSVVAIGETTKAANASIVVPPGYTVTELARQPQFWSPYRMELAPDGRIFVLEQAGRVRIVKNDVMLGKPFYTFPTTFSTDRGLISMALSPNFPATPYIYFYWSANVGNVVVNKITRITANGDVAVPGSEVNIWQSDPLDQAFYHYGGGMWIGADGKLYLATGDRLRGPNASSLTSRWGKILRINTDGTIPTDNPFYAQTTGAAHAIWALGLRNPWQSTVRESTGDVYLSDVGSNTWEELDKAASGANYGWPTYEGTSNGAPGYTDPVWQYHHDTGTPNGCAIVGGDFYEPAVPKLPAQYNGTLLIADHCNGWVKSVDVDHGNTVRDLFDGFERPVDVKVGQQGQIYVLTRMVDGVNGAGLFRIDYVGGNAPAITQQPQSQTVSAGAPATFTAAASGGSGTLRFQWQRNGINIAGATGTSFTIAHTTVGQSGQKFRVVVSDDNTSVNSQVATLTVTNDQPPQPQILTPTAGTTYGGGETINYSGSATDPESGTLPPSAFTWSVVFHHNTHTHDFLPSIPGVTGGSFTIPVDNETDSDVFYRIHLSVRDPQGVTTEVTRDVVPRLVQVTVQTSPANLLFTLGGTQFTNSITFTGVEGIRRNLGAVTPQSSGGNGWSFVSWSDSGAANHDISTPTIDTTYTVTYEPAHKAAFVVGDVTTLGSDGIVVTKLQSWGWDVTLVDDSDATAASANGEDLVLISSSSDVSFGTAFRDVTVPVVLWKPALYDDLRMTGTVANTDFGTVTPVRTVDIVGGSPHPLAAGGPRTVTLTSADVRLPFGQPAGASSVVGTTSGLPSLFTFSPGDAMYGGFTAPACRVAFPGYLTAFPKFTAAGWTLFQQTIDWIRAGCDSGAP